jgi:hypothetical protein
MQTPERAGRHRSGNDTIVGPVGPGNHGGMVSPSKRDRAGQPAPPAQDPIAVVLHEIRDAGSDPAVPHQTRHFIYVPGVKPARRLAQLLEKSSRQIDIDTSARKGYWLVVIRESLVVTPETVAALRAEFEAAARPLGGQYDRWQVDLARS